MLDLCWNTLQTLQNKTLIFINYKETRLYDFIAEKTC